MKSIDTDSSPTRRRRQAGIRHPMRNLADDSQPPYIAPQTRSHLQRHRLINNGVTRNATLQPLNREYRSDQFTPTYSQAITSSLSLLTPVATNPSRAAAFQKPLPARSARAAAKEAWLCPLVHVNAATPHQTPLPMKHGVAGPLQRPVAVRRALVAHRGT